MSRRSARGCGSHMRNVLFISLFIFFTTTLIGQTTGKKGPDCTEGNLATSSTKTKQTIDHFLAELNASLAKQDKQAVANLMAFPLLAVDCHKKFHIRSRAEFVRRFNQIFDKSMVEFLGAQKASCVSRVGAHGLMAGNGEIWFDEYPDG